MSAGHSTTERDADPVVEQPIGWIFARTIGLARNLADGDDGV